MESLCRARGAGNLACSRLLAGFFGRRARQTSRPEGRLQPELAAPQPKLRDMGMASCGPGRTAVFAALVVLILATASCGYHVSGRGDLLPKTLHTIAIPAFGNITTRYKLTDRLPDAIAREFFTRTRYQVIPDGRQADVILNGTIINAVAYPIISDPTLGRATAMQVNITLSVTLTERATGKVLYSRPSFEMHQRYEISIDPQKYFEESDTALDRLCRDTARTVVSGILENF
jgi:hypothetical protein